MLLQDVPNPLADDGLFTRWRNILRCSVSCGSSGDDLESRPRALVEAGKKAILDGTSRNRNLVKSSNWRKFRCIQISQIAEKMRSEMINPPSDDILMVTGKKVSGLEAILMRLILGFIIFLMDGCIFHH